MQGKSLKIFHCADLHLGLRFPKYPEELSTRLRDARFTTLEKMVAAANQEGCQLFVVAGDLFDTLKVPAKEVARASSILAGFGGITAVLPGNHDFHSGAGDDFWKNFPRPEHGRLQVLDENRAYSFPELDAVLYAAPCGSKYSETHGVGWLSGAERPEAAFHVGVAHGSFEGLSPDIQGNYFPMKAADLEKHKLDLWLLGHIHLQFPPRTPGASDRIFYSGTHEPDGFDCRHEGKAWILELGAGGALAARSVSTGQFRFRKEEAEIHSAGELDKILARIPPEERPRTLLKLSLHGALGRDEREKVGAALAALQGAFLNFQPDLSGVTLALSPEDIDREFARETFPHRLLSELAKDEGSREAVQAAFELLQESGERA